MSTPSRHLFSPSGYHSPLSATQEEANALCRSNFANFCEEFNLGCSGKWSWIKLDPSLKHIPKPYLPPREYSLRSAYKKHKTAALRLNFRVKRISTPMKSPVVDRDMFFQELYNRPRDNSKEAERIPKKRLFPVSTCFFLACSSV